MNFVKKGLWIVVPLLLLFASGLAQAQTQTVTAPASPTPTDAQKQERIARELQELQSMKKDLQRQIGDFDARMKALETELGAPHPKQEAAPQSIQATNGVNGLEAKNLLYPPGKDPLDYSGFWGLLEPIKGFVVARTPYGELSIGVFAYLRYLNQKSVEPSFVDAFGRTIPVKQRQDFQVNRDMINFRGWLFDERFRYLFWVWTQNANMGDQTQVNVGGNAMYEFYKWLIFRGGIFSLPTTRSTSQSFPNWLKIDHRTMADEYFRGSYTTGVMLEGRVDPARLQYKAALGNNLSTLGVDAAQLDNGLNTVATALWWMPTTGEFGPGLGFGDYEEHENLATLFGVHYTHSRESRQSQPLTSGFENTQFFLSDGTLIFSPDPFGTGGHINNLTYQMVDLEMGYKLKGWSLEGEYYFRTLNNFDSVGHIPVGAVLDNGFQLQLSTMLVPKLLQTYFTSSKVLGQYGNPWELGFGVTLFPFRRKEMRMNFQTLYESQAPAGNNALPFSPGDKGLIFTVDMGVWF